MDPQAQTSAQANVGYTDAPQHEQRLEPKLLDLLTEYKPGDDRAEATRPVDGFLSATTLAEQIRAYLGRDASPAEVERLRRWVARDIATIDDALNLQVNAILHHPRFQTLESAWRGLWYTVHQAEAGREQIEESGERGTIEVRVMNITKRDLIRDFERAPEFDQSLMFREVYEAEFGTAGGEPYGAVIANYEFTNHPDDIDLLESMSGVAASAFAPLLAGAGPDLVGLDDFSKLEQPLNLEANFAQTRYVKWKALRDRPDSQFLGLTLPRILMREPWRDDGSGSHGFRFTEEVDGPDKSNYLWGTSAWAFGGVLLRAYASTGWFADIRGAKRGSEEGGIVTDIPVHGFGTDSDGVAIKSCTDIALSDSDERALGQLGFIPLSDCQDTPYSVFFSNQSVHEPRVYDDPVATANAKISSMIQYVMCCARFAHYLKLLARNKVGTYQNPQELENWLNTWLVDYVTGDDRARPEMKAQYPLREAAVQVKPIPAQPGNFRLTINLRPHYQLDQLAASVRLVARVQSNTGMK